MKFEKRYLAIIIGVIFTFLLFNSTVYSTTAGSQDPDAAPFGLAIQSDAPGIKLYGVICIEYFNIQPPNPDGEAIGEGRAILRLRKGNSVPEAFYGEIHQVDTLNIVEIQEALRIALEPRVIASFFSPEDVGLLGSTLKSLTELSDPLQLESTVFTNGSVFFCADVDFAVKDTHEPAQSVTIDPTLVNVIEGGGPEIYSVVLDREPVANVQITVDPDSQTDVGAGPGTPIFLTFTPANWSVPVDVLVTAVDDLVIEGPAPHFSTITHSATSSDFRPYNSIPISDVTAVITDNDL